MARELVGDVSAADTRLKNLTRLIADTITAHGTRLPTVGGVGPVVAARPLGWTGRVSRFPTSSAFANYAGVAPVEVPAATTPGIDCLTAVIGSSTIFCTLPRSPR
jgi:transposase